jgi:hypothetical protein
MAIVNANTTKLIAAGEELEKLTNDCGVLLDELYKKLYTINTKCWISEAANRYVSSIKTDYETNRAIIDNLMKYALFVKEAGTEMEDIIKRWS